MKNNINNFNEQQKLAMRTAFLTAFPKIFTDIDYSMEIFSALKNLALQGGLSFEPNLFSNDMAIEIEARHKSLNNVLNKYIDNDTLVIEIAAGMSPRHLQYQNVGKNYLEIDFLPVIEIKKEIYKVLGFCDWGDTLIGADVSNIEQLHQGLLNAIKERNYKKVIVINEGLFWYISKDIIKNMTLELLNVFRDKDFIWITSDCPVEKKNLQEYRKVISDSAKVKRGTFEDYNDFTRFFENLGLNNDCYKMMDLLKYDEMFSSKFLSIGKDETKNRLDSYTDIAILHK